MSSAYTPGSGRDLIECSAGHAVAAAKALLIFCVHLIDDGPFIAAAGLRRYSLMTMADYQAHLTSAGFQHVDVADVTNEVSLAPTQPSSDGGVSQSEQLGLSALQHVLLLGRLNCACYFPCQWPDAA